ncbi:hypothetical protein TSUD_35210 [Trifolium subterraneum]|uniref:non-specific serine/threonine protein kinase n=2 Tax=Trifolium TaxID=3898 RepID=A0A2Z6LUK8_TRISU|nr:hypothetical protein TSUD_35210 [Trifolium subterraneum]
MAASVGVAPTSGFREATGHGEIGVDDILPEEMNDMKIRDDREMEATVVDSGNGTETGHIIVTTIGGRNGQPKQIFRALSYIHRCIGVCHRDIKPQNLLVNPHTHQVKLCDFGSAKVLVKGEPNISYICSRYYRAPELIFGATEYTTAIDVWSVGCVLAELLLGQVKGEPNISYICSRYYRAPELIFGATEYTTAIDVWSVGCVLAELLLGQPLFPGESGVDQLVEIIKVLGTPTREEIKCMNPNYTEFKFPQIKAHPWHKIFHKRMPPEAVDLVSRLLQYSPNLRCQALDALTHPFFDELRDPNARLPTGRFLPPLFNFKPHELKGIPVETLVKLVPEHARKQCPFLGL